MVLPMARPWKNPTTGVYHLRCRVPAKQIALISGRELRVEVAGNVVTIRPREFFKFSLRTKNPAEAKLKHGEAMAALALAIARIGAPPTALSLRQVVALAGEAYRAFTGALEDDPGDQLQWVKALHTAKDVAIGEYGAGTLLIGTGAKVAASLEERYGPLADGLLASKGLNVTPEARKALVQQLGRAMVHAHDRLAGAAGGDYSPDAFKPTLPEWVAPVATGTDTQKTSNGVAFEALFERYLKTPSFFQRRERTRITYRRIVVDEFPKFLKEHAGHEDAARVAKADVMAWRDHMLAGGTSPQTVRRKKLAALGAAYQAGADALLVPLNPVTGTAPNSPRPIRSRERGFTDDEAKTILRAVRDFRPTPRHLPQTVAAFRWLPWIGAYTGARTTEIAQLRGEDFREGRDGLQMRFTPDAGEIKSDSYRDIPAHPHLLELGLVEFVKEAGSGPLFYRPPKPGEVSASKARSVATRLGQWVRETAGITDVRVQPNYGWRHWFKTEARRAGMDSEASEWIMGHTLPGQSAAYGDMAGLRREIDKLPRIDLDEA